MKNLLLVLVVALGLSASARADSVSLNNPAGGLARVLLQPEVQKCLKKYAKEQRGEPEVTQGSSISEERTSVTYSVDGGNAILTVTESFVRTEGAAKAVYDCSFSTY